MFQISRPAFVFLCSLSLGLAAPGWALGSKAPRTPAPPATPRNPSNPAAFNAIKKVMIVVMENTDYDGALKQSFLSQLAKDGALLTNFSAITHPSQPNYIAMAAGALHGVNSNKNYDLEVSSIADLLEAKGKTWKSYAEGYPAGKCFLEAGRGAYVRKHNPLISFTNIQKNPARCARIVPAAQLDEDIRQNKVPNFSFYIPDLNNDGHDTGIKYGDNWLRNFFTPKLHDSRFMDGMLFIVTFDENEGRSGNQIYTSLTGAMVKSGTTSNKAYTLYSLLRTIEEIFDLDTLGQNDVSAPLISDVWN